MKSKIKKNPKKILSLVLDYSDWEILADKTSSVHGTIKGLIKEFIKRKGWYDEKEQAKEI